MAKLSSHDCLCCFWFEVKALFITDYCFLILIAVMFLFFLFCDVFFNYHNKKACVFEFIH